MKIECEVRPTEDKEKLKKMLSAVFKGVKFKEEQGKITGEISEKDFLSLCEEKQTLIIPQMLEENKEVKLSKLALFAGKLVPDEDFPLGAVVVKKEN